jgi:hypothetical protein
LKRAIIVLAALLPLLAACKPQDNNTSTNVGTGKNDFRTVCKDDIAKYCANESKERRCLKQNVDKLSDACKTAIKKKRGGGKKKNKDTGNAQDSTDE